ncbi:lipopolysaccharide biosynthesis protein [Haloferax marisrubri]|uniref:Polysaccharide biosynthesis protein n=1 Tax=Haloferax marisrubri TaxID=1544719 RepID=A0A2P4NQW2_9EURY|nr:polysaccharide biosynthesis C-terminal domain-containing protein [Haloferax marisrubri]POG55523.1 polysaccharide biosynthesis protein [Haloferax marisrubri]
MSSRIVRGFLSIVSARIGAIIVTMIVTPILVRILGSSQYGEYAVIVSSLGLINIILDGGLFDGLRKFIAERPDSTRWRNEIFGFYFRFGMGLTITGVIVILIGTTIGIPSRVFGDEFTSYFIFGAGILIGRQLFSIFRSTLMGFGRESKSEPLRVISQLVFGIFAYLLVSSGFGVNGVLLGRIISLSIICLIGFYFVQKFVDPLSIFSKLSEDISREKLLSFSFQSVAFALLTESLYHVDILLLQSLSGSSSTGYYKAALVVAEFLWFAPVSIQTVFLHATSQLWNDGKVDKINSIAGRVTRYTLLLSLLLAIGLASLSHEFITLYYGPSFSESVSPLMLLLPGTIGFAVARPIFAIGQGKGELRLILIATAAAAIINVVLNILLIPKFGMNGAAIATSIGYGSMLAFHSVAARYLGFNPLSDLRLGRILLTCGVSAPMIFVIPNYIASDILSLLITPLVGALIFIGMTIISGAVRPSEISNIIKNI